MLTTHHNQVVKVFLNWFLWCYTSKSSHLTTLLVTCGSEKILHLHLERESFPTCCNLFLSCCRYLRSSVCWDRLGRAPHAAMTPPFSPAECPAGAAVALQLVLLLSPRPPPPWPPQASCLQQPLAEGSRCCTVAV